MFTVYRHGPLRYSAFPDRFEVGKADNAEAAKAMIPDAYEIEEDEKNPGCYDAITAGGVIYSIEFNP